MEQNSTVYEQLKRLGFNGKVWNQLEISELPNILLPGEEIFECVNGWYENGVALLLGTNMRILLVDKKPLKYLTVEDIRFDMINQIDYFHRLFDAGITITTGVKMLRFHSFNQPRLRKLISHVQHRMAEVKFEIENPNYIRVAQQKALTREEVIKKNEQFNHTPEINYANEDKAKAGDISYVMPAPNNQYLYDDAMRDIFGDTYLEKRYNNSPPALVVNNPDEVDMDLLRIAYSKLPQIIKGKIESRKLEKEVAGISRD